MYLKSPWQTRYISFYVKHSESAYTVYARSKSLQCFECGEIDHKQIACPGREKDTTVTEDSTAAGQSSDGAGQSQRPVVREGVVSGQCATGDKEDQGEQAEALGEDGQTEVEGRKR